MSILIMWLWTFWDNCLIIAIISVRETDLAANAVELDGDTTLMGWLLRGPKLRARYCADSVSVKVVVPADWGRVRRSGSAVFVAFAADEGLDPREEEVLVDDSSVEDEIDDRVDED